MLHWFDQMSYFTLFYFPLYILFYFFTSWIHGLDSENDCDSWDGFNMVDGCLWLNALK